MMTGDEGPSKAPVSALQEYLMKKGITPPTYEFEEILEDGNKLFQCIVTANTETAVGMGRSKREAKHEAADSILKKFQISDGSVRYNPQVQMPTVDAVIELRFLCMQRNHPFPIFEIVQEIGPPAPEFVCKCSVATIVRYGTSSTKKWARQLAAQALIDIIQNIPISDGFGEIIKQREEENLSKFKLYKEAIESDIRDQPGVLLSQRHNYFKNFPNEKKEKAFQILRDSMIYSSEDKVDLILKELNIKSKMSTIQTSKGPDMVFIELLCDIDVVFANYSENIYDEILDYFEVMLN